MKLSHRFVVPRNDGRIALAPQFRINLALIDRLITRARARARARGCIYLVRLEMINDAGEGDVATLSNRVVLQECQKFGQDLRLGRRLTWIVQLLTIMRRALTIRKVDP